MIGDKYKIFKLLLLQDWYNKGDIIKSGDIILEVLEKPKRKWYHLLFQYITFGWYKASYYYKIKRI